jgi:outer membrane protein assembly factor BamB
MNTRSASHAKRRSLAACAALLAAVCLVPTLLRGADWPQWRGANRDAKIAGFEAPKAWPKELAQKWKVPVGPGDGTPALVGDKLYVFVRDAANEIALCLDAATGKEAWRDKYEAAAAAEPMGRHPGPRSSPTVANGKVLTHGVRGQLSCLDAATGKVLWRKDEFPGSWPRFFTASSPLVTDSMCIAQLGGEEKGGMVAYDLATGEAKWKFTSDGSAYASPILMTVGDTKLIVALTASKIVGVGLADGKLLWEAPFPVQRMAYNADTPIVDGQTVIYSGGGRGTKALKIETGFTAKELWSNPAIATQFDNPVLKDGKVYGITQKGELFCLDAQTGKTLWTAPLPGAARGFGSVVDAGSVLFALSPDGELVVFEPSDKEFKKLAGYKVGLETYAYPVISGNKIYVKDKDSLALWAIE